MRGKTALLISIPMLLLAAGCDPGADPNSMVGRTAGDFEVQTLQSQAFTKTLASCKGKPVILDFWATWCGPCRQLSPHVEKIYDEFKDKGLQAMAISDQSRMEIEKFESNTPHKIPVYVDQNELATYAYKVQALPTVVIIDRNGKIVYQQAGFIEGQIMQTENAMRAAVQKAVDTPVS